MPEPKYDVFFLDGFDWCDALDFFEVPHYSNDHKYRDSETYHYRIRLVDIDDCEENIIVLWVNRDEPTDAEIKAAIDQYDEERG